MKKRLKISYLSLPAFTDCDLPLVAEMSKMSEVHYYIIAYGDRMQGTLLDVKLKKQAGIFSACEYPEMASLAKWLPLENIYVINMPVKKDLAFKNIKTIFSCVKKMQRNKYDVIHLTWPLRYGLFPFYRLKNKMVLTVHDPLPHSSEDTFFNRMQRKLAMMLTPNFILLNKTQRQDFLSKYKIDESNVFQSRLSIYTHLHDIELAKPMIQHKYILYIGTIHSHKGIEYLCEAIEKIKDTHSDVHLVIAGKGDFYFDIDKYKVDNRFHVINRFITNEEMVSLISHSLFVVCPYKDATQSGVIMSAFALDKPVLATRVGALHEMINDNEYGILVEPQSSEAIANGIHRMLSEGTLDKMRENIHRDYTQGELSWSNIAQNTISIFQSIVNKKK